MNQREACRILGIDGSETPLQIRRRYHMLLHRYHPDSAGSDDALNLEQSRSVIEAFRFLKREGTRTGVKTSRDWGVWENNAAFCSRKIYMEDDLFGDPIVLATGSQGRYYWDPDLETFPMFLRSVGEAARDRMDEVSERLGPEADEPGEEEAIAVKGALLHLLIQEFIDPYACLDQMYPYICRNASTEDLYEIRCHILADPAVLKKLEQAGKGTDAMTKEGACDNRRCLEEVRICAADNRLEISLPDGSRGKITFEESALYYVVIPLFLQGAVRYSLQCMEGRRGERGRAAYLNARLLLQVDRKKKTDLTGKINTRITQILRTYEASFLRTS